MARSNVVRFPVAKLISDGRPPRNLSKIRSISRQPVNGLRRLLRKLIVSAIQKALCMIVIGVLVVAWLGRLMFGVLSLGFLGKLWLHWGASSASVPAMEFGESLLIFCLLSALLAWVTGAAPVAPAPVVRLSLWDRLLLVSRR